MVRLLVLGSFLLALPVQAATEPRCGIDAFGNRVCIDKDGVTAPAPRAAKGNQQGKTTEPETADEEGAAQQNRPRCAVDSFGNTVCLK